MNNHILSGSDGKEPVYNARGLGSIHALGRSLVEGNGNEFSCLKTPTDRRAWYATVHGVAKHWTQLRD